MKEEKTTSVPMSDSERDHIIAQWQGALLKKAEYWLSSNATEPPNTCAEALTLALASLTASGDRTYARPPGMLDAEFNEAVKAVVDKALNARPEEVGRARRVLASFEEQLSGDGTLAFKPDYVAAAAVLKIHERDAFERLRERLRPSARVTEWDRVVDERIRKTNESSNAASGGSQGSDSGRDSVATQLANLAIERASFCHSGDDCYATIEVEGHRETLALKSAAFKRWLAHEYFALEGKAAGSEAMTAAINALSGHALFKCAEENIYVRLATSGAKVYVDLGDPQRRVVEVAPDGWTVIESYACPVRFRRPKAMLALPAPQRGGTLDDLRPFVNIKDTEDFKLIVGWMLGTYRERGPFPVLVLHGEHGSAKSTTTRVLRSLIDPNEAPLRNDPRDSRDLMIAARNGRLLAFDNLSHIPGWLSDALCRVATGGGLATRTLYTDEEETIFQAQRPCLINGIEELAARPDLLDRAIIVYLPRIEEEDRQTEDEFFRKFEDAQSRIFGALLDAISCAMRNEGHVRLNRTPRMADFAVWVEAASPVVGWSHESFLDVYSSNRRDAVDLALETPVAEALRRFSIPWFGTATELLEQLQSVVDEGTRRAQAWPKTAPSLSNALRRLAPNLRHVGVDVSFTREAHGKRIIKIVRCGQFTESSSPSSPSSPATAQSQENITCGDAGDAGDDVHGGVRSEEEELEI